MPAVRDQGDWAKGKVRLLQHQSVVLRDNPWGDPADRTIPVYLPAGYADSEEPYITLWDLAAFTNSGPGHMNWRNHGENLPDRLDRLIGTGRMPAVVVVMPDCYTSLGGNQYVNSPAVGRYADYLVEELVPFVGRQVNTVDGRDGRGVFGKSSGGFGAMYHGMHFPETWGAVASHAGDVGFDLVYRPVFAECCVVLAEHGGDPEAFIRSFWRKNRPAARDFSALMTLAMAASYDPDPGQPGRIRLPFDLRTCAVNPERWAKWLAFDPLNQVHATTAALKALHALYFDAGSWDQYHIQFGSRLLAEELTKLGVAFDYEEFAGDHSNMDWRLDYSLPLLAHSLKRAIDAAN